MTIRRWIVCGLLATIPLIAISFYYYSLLPPEKDDTEQCLNRVQIGMSREEVVRIMRAPYGSANADGGIHYYSVSGFARIVFDEDRVIEKSWHLERQTPFLDKLRRIFQLMRF